MVRSRFRHNWNRALCCRIRASALAVACCGSAFATDAIYTNQDVFYIPFTAQATESGGAPGQVTLFASGDYGVSWHAYQTQSIAAGRFSFRAGADGEFWFAVRDASVTTLAAGVTPELRVVVDRVAPTLDFQAAWAQPGMVSVEWSVDDAAALDPPVSFESRPESAATAWQAIRVPVEAQRANGHRSGRFTFAADAAAPYVIRATSQDKAGNRTVLERKLLERSTDTATDSAPSPVPSPLGLPDPGILPLPHPPQASDPTPPAPTNESAATPSLDTRDGQWQADQPTGGSPQPNGILAALEPQPLQNPNAIEATIPQQTPAPPATAESHRFSRSRRFQMDYVVENGAAGGVHRVEAWFTNDGGRSWRHYGDDSDRQSPMEIDVAEDGTYGFRLLIQAREGLVAQPPRSGDAPDAWVTVDSQPPEAHLTSARFGNGAQLGSMTITWEAHDQLPAEFPIGLFFGESAQGPWRKITSELPNSGSYLWQIDDRVPAQFYLRLEVTDRAGNVAADVLQNPIRRDGFAPQGTIRGIRPIGFSGR